MLHCVGFKEMWDVFLLLDGQSKREQEACVWIWLFFSCLALLPSTLEIIYCYATLAILSSTIWYLVHFQHSPFVSTVRCKENTITFPWNNRLFGFTMLLLVCLRAVFGHYCRRLYILMGLIRPVRTNKRNSLDKFTSINQAAAVYVARV